MKTLRLSAVLQLLACALVLLTASVPSFAQALTSHTISAPYVSWTFPRGFTKLETDLKVTADPGTTANWFIAHQFGVADSAGNVPSGGYIGLQTNIPALGGKKGVMFSLWNTTVASPGSGATCQAFGGEGTGMQCFVAYPWVANRTYRLRVVYDRGVYKGYVVDMGSYTKTETYVGQIQAPAATVGFSRNSIQWLEYYGVPPANCADFRYLKVTWVRPNGDGGATVPGTPSYYYASNGYCKNASVVASGNDSIAEAGNPGTGTRVNLMGNLGKYVYTMNTAEGCGGAGLRPDGAGITACSKLTRVALAGGKVALQAENGYYLSCAGGGGSTVAANARKAGTNESFTETVSSGLTTYKSARGYYLSAVNYGAIDFKCSAMYPGATEKFTQVINKAPKSVATVSSESAATQQLGIKAIDGAVEGYPGDHSKEWVTNGETAGAWIQLKWSVSTPVKQIMLYDRPNLADQITAGTLFFSDGSSMAVGALPNDGIGLQVSFGNKNLTWVKFRIDQAVGLPGLAEIEAY